jgi:hypothetical protein
MGELLLKREDTSASAFLIYPFDVFQDDLLRACLDEEPKPGYKDDQDGDDRIVKSA